MDNKVLLFTKTVILFFFPVENGGWLGLFEKLSLGVDGGRPFFCSEGGGCFVSNMS